MLWDCMQPGDVEDSYGMLIIDDMNKACSGLSCCICRSSFLWFCFFVSSHCFELMATENFYSFGKLRSVNLSLDEMKEPSVCCPCMGY